MGASLRRWGRTVTALPPGYDWLSGPQVQVAARSDLAPACRSWLLERHLAVPDNAEPIGAGRGGAYRIELPGGRRAVVRPYRRGGILGPLWRDRYVALPHLGRPTRPLRELAVTVAARARGVPVPEVLAARIEGCGIYRGTLVTAELEAMEPLITVLRAERDEHERSRFAASAGVGVALMHRAALYHADLNLWNILVRPGAPDHPAAIIDLDRAWLADGGLPAAARARNLERFARSRKKLDPDCQVMTEAVVAAFAAAYERSLGAACES
jgi:3-deoxy-D-manno-octulosonic acid kinase